jgi:aldehyde dehydrogenase (NAD+)
MLEALDAGTVWLNTFRTSSVMLPVAGYKQSGLGSENGQTGLLNFMKPKTAYVNHGGQVSVPFMD